MHSSVLAFCIEGSAFLIIVVYLVFNANRIPVNGEVALQVASGVFHARDGVISLLQGFLFLSSSITNLKLSLEAYLIRLIAKHLCFCPHPYMNCVWRDSLSSDLKFISYVISSL